MNQYKRLGNNMAWMTVGSFASKFLSFLLIPFYTSVLTTAEYGTADIIVTTVTLLAPLLTLQINESVIRFSLDNDIDKKQVITIGVFIITLGFVVLLLMTPFLCSIKQINDFYFLFLLYYWSITTNTLFSQYLKGIDLIQQYAISGVLNTITVITCNLVLLLVFKIGIQGYILSLIMGNIVSIFYLLVVSRLYKSLIWPREIDTCTLRSMLKYSVPMIPNSLSWWVSNSSNKYILNYFIGTAAVGIYSIAYKIPTLLSTINTIFMSAWQISAVENFGSVESRKFFSDIYQRLSSLNAIVVSLLVLFSKLIAKVLYAKDFFIAWKYAVVLLFAFFFSSLSSFLGSVYTTSKNTKVLFYTSAVGAVTNIVINLFLIPIWGAFGAAIATLLSYFFVWIIRAFNVDTILLFEKKILKNVLCSLIIIAQILLAYGNDYIFDVLSGVLFIMMVCVNRTFVLSTIKMIHVTMKLI